MVPAMDRFSNPPGYRRLLGLALLLASVDLGCAEIESIRHPRTPATIGSERAGRDVYAEVHRARTPEAGPDGLVADALADPPTATEGREVGLAIVPAVSPGSGVDLGPPASMALVATTPRPAPASTGVPNGSILLASSDRKPRPIAPAPENAGRIVAEARKALDAMASYQVLMHRQERVNGTLQPEEDVVLAIRREPRAVRLSWPTGPHKGREVLYRADEPAGLMHVNLADSALPIPRLSIPPMSPMVMKNSRHPVTEAGFDPLILGLEAPEGSLGVSALAYNGLGTPPPLDHPHHCLTRTSASGEVSRVYIDPRTHLPALFAVDGPNGELLERYVFRDVLANPPDLAANEAFDPNARWGPPRGLFGRVARGADASTVWPPR